VDRGLSIRSIDDVERLARIAVTSGYTACRKPEEAAMLILTGHELGLSPMQSLRGIYVVSGKPVLSADLMVAVIRGSGLCDSWRTVECTPERCTITTRRKGETHDATRTWTMGDAKRAGITGKGTWSAYPATMLRHRCAADLAREVYPDVLLGLYDPEELEPVAQTAPEPAIEVAVERDPELIDALAAQVERCDTIDALGALWTAAKADVAALDDRSAQERVWSLFKSRARALGGTVKALQAAASAQPVAEPVAEGGAA
jgi:hypothetical protein